MFKIVTNPKLSTDLELIEECEDKILEYENEQDDNNNTKTISNTISNSISNLSSNNNNSNNNSIASLANGTIAFNNSDNEQEDNLERYVLNTNKKHQTSNNNNYQQTTKNKQQTTKNKQQTTKN